MNKLIPVLNQNEFQALADLVDGGIRHGGFDRLCPEWLSIKYKIMTAQNVADPQPEIPPVQAPDPAADASEPAPPVDKGENEKKDPE